MEGLKIFLEPAVAKYFIGQLDCTQSGQLKIPRMNDGFKEVFMVLLEEQNSKELFIYPSDWTSLQILVPTMDKTLRIDKKFLVISPLKMRVLNAHIKNLLYFEINKSVEWGSSAGYGQAKIMDVIQHCLDKYGISESDLARGTVYKQNYRHRNRAERAKKYKNNMTETVL